MLIVNATLSVFENRIVYSILVVVNLTVKDICQTLSIFKSSNFREYLHKFSIYNPYRNTCLGFPLMVLPRIKVLCTFVF